MPHTQKYAQARLALRQFTRLFILDCKADDEDEAITPEERWELSDLEETVRAYPGSTYDEKCTWVSRQLLGCRTVMPRWLQMYFCEAIALIEPSETTYHEAAVADLVSWIACGATPKDWRRQLYPIYLADIEFHGHHDPSPEGFDVWLIDHVHVLRHMSELWPWDAKELTA